MADKDDGGILAEFQEFLTQREAANAQAAADADDEVEIWNEKGQGARVRRSVAKPFLQSLGIDLDPPASDDGSDSGSGDGDGKGQSKGPGKGRSAPPKQSATSSVARKYFVKATGK